MGFRHYPAIVAALRNPLEPVVCPPPYSIHIYKSVPTRISAAHGCEAACMRPASGLDAGAAGGIAMSMQTDASAHDATGSSEQMQRDFARVERVAHTDFLFPESREHLIDLLQAHRADFAPSEISRLLTAKASGFWKSQNRESLIVPGGRLWSAACATDRWAGHGADKGAGQVVTIRFFTGDIAMDNKDGGSAGFFDRHGGRK